jgi:hypothetical protein
MRCIAVFVCLFSVIVSCSSTEEIVDNESKTVSDQDTRALLMEQLETIGEESRKLSLKYEAFDKIDDKRYMKIMDMYHASQSLYYGLKRDKNDSIAASFFFIRQYNTWRKNNYRNYNLYHYQD